MARHHPGVPLRREVHGHATLFDTTACTGLLGFTPRRTWRTTTGSDEGDSR
jgi:hypothetical protein